MHAAGVYAAYPNGTLGGFGLGALTYPAWIPTSTKATGAALAQWKNSVAFAMGIFDLWHDFAAKARSNPNDTNLKASADRFASYLKPDIALNPNNTAFWSQTPERKSDYAKATKQAGHHGGFHSSESFDPSKVVEAITDVITAPVNAIATVTESIPVLGDLTRIVSDAASAPGNIANAIASGARLDHVAVNALKAQLKLVKDVAPYAQTVVSLVPGIGSGVAAAVGIGVTLAEGQNITEAVKAGIRGAIPGGPLAQAGFDAALKVAAGENVAKAALEGVRAQLSPAAQKAFDVGLAVVTGEKIQTALANGLASLAPSQIQTLITAGQKAVSTMPGLSNALKNVAPGAATQGFQIASGLLSQAGINEKAVSAARNALSTEVRQGFDAALKTQEPHIAWLKNVTEPAATAMRSLEPPRRPVAATAPTQPAPRSLEPPKRPAAHYAPYPKTGLSEEPPSTSTEVRSPTHTATEVRSPTSTSTEVRSPTSTSTEAYTQGNFTVTVTGGAGSGATNVEIQAPPLNRENVANSKGAPKNAQENQNINAPRPRGPTAQENSSVNAPRAGALSGSTYAPYPKMSVAGALSGPPPDCHSLGAPIANMPHGMRQAGLSAVNGTGGRPRMVHGPDGNDYLFALEGDALVARQCHQKRTESGVSGASPYAPYTRV